MATMAEADDYGGYDELVGKVDDKFYCFVCQEIMRDPVLTRCCRQNYCHSCYQQWKRSDIRNRCPLCRQVNHTVQWDTSFQQEISTFKVNCPNRSVGCQWSTQLQQRSTIKHHLKNGCQYTKVECTLKCGETVYRGQLKQHMDNCPQRPFECKYCGKKGTYSTITGETKVTGEKEKVLSEKGHYAECPKNIKKCPNHHCQKTMQQKDIMHHRKQCQYEPVHCSFQGLNYENTTMTCGKKMLRSELPNHQKICPLRPYKCKFCSKESTYAAITGDKSNMKQHRIPPEQGHYAECHDYPLVCKNKCQSNTIKRSKMEAHLKECPLQLVPCPAEDVGCEVKMKRKDINKHMEHYRVMERHLALYGSAYKDTKTELATRLADLNSTKAELDTTKVELNTKKIELNRANEKLRYTEQHLHRTNHELNHTKEEFQRTKQDLNHTKNVHQRTRQELSRTTEELQITKQELNRAKEESQRTKRELNHTKGELHRAKQGQCRQS